MNLGGLATATVDLGFFARARNAWRSPDLRPAWKEARKPVRADMRDHAKRAAGPGGSWAARSSATKTRSSGRKRARKLLGRLPGALSIKSERRRLLLTSRVKWSAIHQDGGTAGHGARIPQRQFLWASAELLARVSTIVARVVVKAFHKA